MPRKCPPGVICIENMTLIFLIAGVSLAIYLLQYFEIKKRMPQIYPKISLSNLFPSQPSVQPPMQHPMPTNILMNPLTPPLRNGNYMPKNSSDPRGMPVNVRTQGYHDAAYRQVGILTRDDGSDIILPLMGRPIHTGRGKWQFYTMNDKNNMIKLPVSKNGKSCTGEYGCDDLYNGDTVYVEGYKDVFKTTIYENDGPQYIPYL